MGMLKAKVSGVWTPLGIADLTTVESRLAYLESMVIPTLWVGVSYNSGWANVGGHQATQYRKIGDSVEIRGQVYRASGTNLPIFTLPVGCRPPYIIQFTHKWWNGSVDQWAHTQIGSDGIMVCGNPPGTGLVVGMSMNLRFSTLIA